MFRTNLEYVEIVTHKSIRKMEIEQIKLTQKLLAINSIKRNSMERQITISIEEYNKLIDMHTTREELPEKIEVKKFTSKWWKWLKRASCSLFHYNKNVEQQKLIKRCIEETASTIREHLINGYWRSNLSEYFKDGNFDISLRTYKADSYRNVMEWLDKKNSV